MGQKTNPNILRLGQTKEWKSKYIEKNNEESSLYLYKTLEIQKYLNRFFGLYKIKIHNCKIFYSENVLQIFISFYLTAKTLYIINKNLTLIANFVKNIYLISIKQQIICNKQALKVIDILVGSNNNKMKFT